MANQKYIMFENTFSDLVDVHDRISDSEFHKDELSASELNYYKKLIGLCTLIAGEFGSIKPNQLP